MKRDRLICSLAAVWGFAEATIFFIVPDVLLSWAAIRSRGTAIIASLWATGAAVLGGTVVWMFGHAEPESFRNLLDAIPAISPEMIAEVRTQLAEYGPVAVFIGPIIGTPYKIYALEAGAAGIGLLAFVAISVPARLIRFLAVSCIAAFVARRLGVVLSERYLYALHVVLWTLVYVLYFCLMADRL